MQRGGSRPKSRKNQELIQIRNFPEENLAGESSFSIKPITNPLLQNLFNRKSLALLNSQKINPKDSESQFTDSLDLLQLMKNRINAGGVKQVTEDHRQTSNNTRSLTSILNLRDQMLRRKQNNQDIFKSSNSEEQNIRSGSGSEKTQLELLLAERKENKRLLAKALADKSVQREKLKNVSKTTENKHNDKEIVKKVKEVEAVERARTAVQRRISTGSDKSSPAVWAAVNALTQFVEGPKVSDKDVPEDIFRAIIQLTNFLDTDKGIGEEKAESLTAQQERLRTQILKQKQQQQQEIENILKAEAVTAFMKEEKKAVSVQQQILRDQILRQKLKQEEEIENILSAEAASKEENKSVTSSMFVVDKDKTRLLFPARIEIPREQDRIEDDRSRVTGGPSFAFSTLPV